MRIRSAVDRSRTNREIKWPSIDHTRIRGFARSGAPFPRKKKKKTEKETENKGTENGSVARKRFRGSSLKEHNASVTHRIEITLTLLCTRFTVASAPINHYECALDRLTRCNHCD